MKERKKNWIRDYVRKKILMVKDCIDGLWKDKENEELEDY